jgi:hypothetical protein
VPVLELEREEVLVEEGVEGRRPVRLDAVDHDRILFEPDRGDEQPRQTIGAVSGEARAPAARNSAAVRALPAP